MRGMRGLSRLAATLKKADYEAAPSGGCEAALVMGVDGAVGVGDGGAGACPFAAAVSGAGADAEADALFLKHWRQSTGRPWVGLNGTVVATPHSEHSVRVSVREMPAAAGPAPGAAC